MKAAVLVAAAALAAGVEQSDFRYVRELRAPGDGPVLFRADGPFFAHARPGFGDLRILDSHGGQVPWRLPPEARTGPEAIRLLNSGRRGDRAVALLDLGDVRRIVDRIELDIPGENFVGRVTVFGSDRREGAFTRLGSTAVYDVAGAEGRARSTAVVFRPTDFRFLRLEATGVSAIAGATVSARPREQRPEPVRAKVRTVELQGRTRVVLDVFFRRHPVARSRSRPRPSGTTARSASRLRPMEGCGPPSPLAGSSTSRAPWTLLLRWRPAGGSCA